MKKFYRIINLSISFCLLAITAQATSNQAAPETPISCTQAPDCADLGYTKPWLDCRGRGVRCPFADLWNCAEINPTACLGDFMITPEIIATVNNEAELKQAINTKKHGAIIIAQNIDLTSALTASAGQSYVGARCGDKAASETIIKLSQQGFTTSDNTFFSDLTFEGNSAASDYASVTHFSYGTTLLNNVTINYAKLVNAGNINLHGKINIIGGIQNTQEAFIKQHKNSNLKVSVINNKGSLYAIENGKLSFFGTSEISSTNGKNGIMSSDLDIAGKILISTNENAYGIEHSKLNISFEGQLLLHTGNKSPIYYTDATYEQGATIGEKTEDGANSLNGLWQAKRAGTDRNLSIHPDKWPDFTRIGAFPGY